MVFWDIIAGVYDLFEKFYNGRCYDGTGARVAQEINENDIVLECACGTGSISKPVAKKMQQAVRNGYVGEYDEACTEKLQGVYQYHFQKN